jgi:hypothetical protein
LTRFTYALTTALTKLSIGVMLLRLINKTRVNVSLIYTSIGINLVACTLVFFFCLFQCKPISYSWRQVIPTEKGTCISPHTIVTLGYILSVVSIVLDFFYAVLPGFIFWGLQMKKSEKVVLMILMSLGVL